jgi:hypothetical protein
MLQLVLPPKQLISKPLVLPHPSHLISYSLFARTAYLWLVILCCSWSVTIQSHNVLIWMIFCLLSCCPKRWYKYNAPLCPHPSCASSLILFLLQTPCLSDGWWLLCLPFKFQLLKAKAPFPLCFSTYVDLHPPNKLTNSGATKQDSERLAWDHRRLRRHFLWAPLT